MNNTAPLWNGICFAPEGTQLSEMSLKLIASFPEYWESFKKPQHCFERIWSRMPVFHEAVSDIGPLTIVEIKKAF
jgi:hypothetical protein